MNWSSRSPKLLSPSKSPEFRLGAIKGREPLFL
jgi:hypothetical protein